MKSIAGSILSPSGLAVAVITIIKVLQEKEKRDKIIRLITSKSWVINLVIIMVFCYYGLKVLQDDSEETNRLKGAIRTAILGMIIAIVSYVELTLAPFWILFVASYYLDINS